MPTDDPPADGPAEVPDPAVGAWLRELARVPAGLLDAHLPTGRGVPARAREQLVLAVVDVQGGTASLWIHGTWLEFLGPRDPEEAVEPLLAYARSCAEAGEPLDTTVLDAVYPRPVVRSVRATVAHAALGSAASLAADRTVRRLRSLVPLGRRSAAPAGGAVRDAAVAVAALPWAVPAVVLAAGMGVANRLAPSLPEVDLPPDDDADLAVHLLAEAVPTYLGSTVLRTLALALPLPISVAVRLEDSTATLQIGRGRIGVTPGVDRDALLVIEGGSEPLLRVVASSILRDLGTGRPLRRPR
ncbi:MAG: hypothetical protein U0Q07_15945 [Acidimicrobiales bacterium]